MKIEMDVHLDDPLFCTGCPMLEFIKSTYDRGIQFLSLEI